MGKAFQRQPNQKSTALQLLALAPTLAYSSDQKNNSNATDPNPIFGFGKKQVGVGQLILPQLPAPSRYEGPNFRGSLHANLSAKILQSCGSQSQGLSCSRATLRLNKVAILVNKPLVAEGHDHGLTATQE